MRKDKGRQKVEQRQAGARTKTGRRLNKGRQEERQREAEG